MKVSDPKQPMFLCRINGIDAYLPSELCNIDGVPDHIREDTYTMSNVLKELRKNPEDKIKTITSFC